MKDCFKKIQWYEDHLTIGDVLLRFEQVKATSSFDDNNSISFYKRKNMIIQYEQLFSEAGSDLITDNIFELGMWDGGSLVFWNEVLNPQKIVGVDWFDKVNTPYFNSYNSKIQNKIKTPIGK